MNFKKFSIISLLSVLLTGCGSAMEVLPQPTPPTTQVSQPEHLSVMASFYPLYELVQKIGGERGEFRNFVPSGVEPHDYEPTPQQLNNLYTSDFVVFNGAGLEPWAEKVKPDLEKSGVKVITLADNISLLEGATEHEHGHEEEEHEEHEHQEEDEHEEPVYDPHFWLDPLTYLEEGRLITQKLSELAPSNTSYYQENFKKLEADLQKLHTDFEAGLQNCDSRTMVTSHAAFAYLAKRYNLAMLPIAGLSPEDEPTAKNLAELAKLVKEKNIQYIFTETLVSPKIAQTLADETGAKTLVLNPLEGLSDEEINAGKTYVSVMRENLENLKIGLGCHLSETQETQSR